VRRAALPALTTAVLALSACTSFGQDDAPRAGTSSSEPAQPPAARAATAQPERLTVVAEGGAAGLAAATRHALS
jgi:hypothetical protein